MHVENNFVGLLVDGSQGTSNGAHVVIRDSMVSGNAAGGILAHSAPGKAPVFIVVERTSMVNNAGIGILANGPRATIILNRRRHLAQWHRHQRHQQRADHLVR